MSKPNESAEISPVKGQNFQLDAKSPDRKMPATFVKGDEAIEPKADDCKFSDDE
jgi:hypothetical protein